MKYIRRMIALAGIGTIAAILIGFAGSIHPAFDTFAQLRLHFSFALLLVSPVLFFIRYRKLAIVSLLVAAAGLYTSSSGLMLSATSLKPDANKPVYSLLHLNLLWNNKHRSEVIDWVIKQDADLLSFSEAAIRWEAPLKKLEKNWPYNFHCPEHNKRGGVRIYSKWPMDTSTDYCGTYGTFGKTLVTTPEGTQIALGSLHLRWPWPASGPKQLRTLIPTLETLEDDALIAGDFNSTPWSYTVQHFANKGGLKVVEGIGATWMFLEVPPTIAKFIGFPIDNILAKGKVRILSAKRMKHVGSDHFPVRVEFQIRD